MILNPARSRARAAAASWVSTSEHSWPSSIIRITPPIWPCARRSRRITSASSSLSTFTAAMLYPAGYGRPRQRHGLHHRRPAVDARGTGGGAGAVRLGPAAAPLLPASRGPRGHDDRGPLGPLTVLAEPGPSRPAARPGPGSARGG